MRAHEKPRSVLKPNRARIAIVIGPLQAYICGHSAHFSVFIRFAKQAVLAAAANNIFQNNVSIIGQQVETYAGHVGAVSRLVTSIQ